MNRCIRWSWLAPCVLLLSGLVTAAPARADFFIGQYTAIAPTAGTNQTSFTLMKGTMLAPFPVAGATVNDLLVDVTAYDPAGGNTNIDLNNTSVPPQFIIFNATKTQKAIFDFANPATLFANDSFLATGSIATDITLDPASPGIAGFNQNAFNTAQLTIDFTGISVVGTKPDGSPDGRASWSGPITATFKIQSTPEPSTLMLTIVGVISLTGITWFRRRRLQGA
jgi:hypothetical protein